MVGRVDRACDKLACFAVQDRRGMDGHRGRHKEVDRNYLCRRGREPRPPVHVSSGLFGGRLSSKRMAISEIPSCQAKNAKMPS